MGEVRKRLFALELTDKETAAFYEKCVMDGTTPEEVLACFVCDLTGAERTSGSDEERLAGEYYERCGYEFYTDSPSFTQWLISTGYIDTMEALLTDCEDLQGELEYYETHKEDEPREGLFAEIQEDIDRAKEQMQEFFAEYKKDESGNLEEELQAVRDYLQKKRKLCEGGTT